MNDIYEKLKVLEREDVPLDRKERLVAISGPLLVWYEGNRRILPWREKPASYRVWISEIVFQQTRVEAVKPYFNRFMEALPTVEYLVKVPEDQFLKLWEGLGYYNRTRNLQKAAQVIAEEYGGQLPPSYEEPLRLSGIGSYTAGAIASIAHGIPVPAVDGNVLRVLSRALASEEDTLKQSVKKQMEDSLRQVIPVGRANAFNQGMIEIGAIIRVPNSQPKCGECPLESIYLAKRHNPTDRIPYKAPKKPRKTEERTTLLLESGDRIAIQKRPDKGLLTSLYEFPNSEGHLGEAEIERFVTSAGGHAIGMIPPSSAKHISSHVEWYMSRYRVKIEGNALEDYMVVEKEKIKTKYPLLNVFLVYTKLVL